MERKKPFERIRERESLTVARFAFASYELTFEISVMRDDARLYNTCDVRIFCFRFSQKLYRIIYKKKKFILKKKDTFKKF